MQLIYLSPVPWISFSQRPHKFVEWFHGATGGDVVWVDPYLTRFPVPTDFRYLWPQKTQEQCAQPHWLRVIKPVAVPIEPLSGAGWANTFLWRRVLHDLDVFSRQRSTLLAIGKPSVLALAVLERLGGCPSVYDAMDNFPAFYGGIARSAMYKHEKQVAVQVKAMLVSSTPLKRQWENVRPDVRLVRNGIDVAALPAPKAVSASRDRKVLGYMGTIAAWFDWDWVVALAKARPADVVHLIGPTFIRVPKPLPQNIEILPPRDHRSALEAMQNFDAGLIPFKKNDLTASVDPIKYYEYRALGLPVISTDFGEMTFRRGEDGTFLSSKPRDIPELVQKALHYKTNKETIRQFTESNTWEARFGAADII